MSNYFQVKMTLGLFLCSGIIILFSAQPGSTRDPSASKEDAADEILGFWETAHKDDGWSRIKVVRRGDKYYGRIVWLRVPLFPEDDPEGMGGQIKIDRRNPDESLRDRPLIGLELLYGFVYDKDRKYKDGRIYDPRNGKTYRCKMEIKEDGSLKVGGYIKIGFIKIGKSDYCFRVDSAEPAPGEPIEPLAGEVPQVAP